MKVWVGRGSVWGPGHWQHQVGRVPVEVSCLGGHH